MFFNTLILIVLFSHLGIKAVNADTITSGSFLSLVYLGKTVYNVGDTFGVIAKVNSVGNKIDGVDGVVNYDGGLLSLISVKKMPSMVFASLGGDCAISQGVSNKVSFTCYLNDPMKSAAVNGDLVMMVFGVKSLGESKINFECGQSLTTESNIVSYSIDIIDCSKNQNLVINMNNGGSTLPSSSSNGKCGTKRNSCNVGNVNDDALPDTKNEYRWKCMGINGGKNVNCSLGKKVDGKCGSKKNTCSSGTISKVSGSSSQYKWKCVGRYGGKTVNCSIRK